MEVGVLARPGQARRQGGRGPGEGAGGEVRRAEPVPPGQHPLVRLPAAPGCLHQLVRGGAEPPATRGQRFDLGAQQQVIGVSLGRPVTQLRRHLPRSLVAGRQRLVVEVAQADQRGQDRDQTPR
jgi:hypothetical protein